MNMIEMNTKELAAINGGENALMQWGEQAAKDGLAAMESSSVIKSATGTLLAVAGGWAYLAGGLISLF